MQIQIDVDAVAGANQAGYDEANALVLPSEKRATKIKVDKVQHVKILTKKQRKHLQAIVDKKKKKEGVGCLEGLPLLSDLSPYLVSIARPAAGRPGRRANPRGGAAAVHIH